MEQVDQDVMEESSVNREITSLILQRLSASRQSVEGLAKLLSALASAEAAYASAMRAALQSCGPMAGKWAQEGSQPCSGMEPALAALSRLPAVIGSSHQQLSSSLSSLAREATKALVQLRSAIKEVGEGATLAHRQVDEQRRALKGGLEQHVSACAALDAALSERAAGRLARAPDRDPWQTEAQLVQVRRSSIHACTLTVLPGHISSVL